MKKILYISAGIAYGGIESLELSYYKYLSNSYHIDILVTDTSIFNDYQEILDNHLYSLNIKRNNLINKLKYDFKLFKFLKKQQYDIIHINSSVFLYSFQISLIAKKCKINKIIAHSHSLPPISNTKMSIIKLLTPIYNKLIDYKLACSKEAASKLFSTIEGVRIINNGIVLNDYKYQKDLRKKYRNNLNISNYKVYGNVARFTSVKNHSLLIDIFYEIQKKEKKSILLLIGDGPLKSTIKQKVIDLRIADKVIFLGQKSSVSKYLNIMDIFILPSISEGFGISLLEAQVNGLPCFISNTIPKTAIISNKVITFDNKNSPQDICNLITKNKNNSSNRRINSKLYQNYDVKNICLELKKIYDK